jgi:flagellar hook-length control protein FliK
VNLRPEELGSIEIRMERGDDGIMRVHVLAERQATLELLKNSASDLNSGLQQSGLKTDAGSMQFNLRDQGQGQFAAFGQSPDNRGNQQGGTLLAQTNQELAYKVSNDDTPATGATRSTYASGLDIRI